MRQNHVHHDTITQFNLEQLEAIYRRLDFPFDIVTLKYPSDLRVAKEHIQSTFTSR